MEDAVVSAATGALGPVLGKLGAVLGDEYRRLRRIRTDINSLTLELKAIDAFLKHMSEEEDPNPQDKAWMKEVRELSYDVEDNLDEFTARVVAAKAKSAQPDGGFVDKIKSWFKRLKARHEIAKKIEDLKKQAIDVSQRNARYRTQAGASNSGASNTVNAQKVDTRALAIFKNASKLVGVDRPKREIIRLLADGESSSTQQQQTKLVAIVGFGGLGKTTIANQVYQELIKVKGQFDCCAFLSVSRNPNIFEVMSKIYGQLNETYHSSGTQDLETLIKEMLNFLQNKRYLIVVDDIWKVKDWERIQCALPTASSGSKIITTTRINEVAESCCSEFGGRIYNIKPLSMVHSRKLLFTRLFNSKEKCPSDLEEISDQILEKCAGLPLSIIAISGVLANKTCKKDQWERVKDSIGRALRNSSNDTMVNIISLSYLDLPPYLRTCLLYLSIFREDHIINKDNLIRRWIGEGFIPTRQGYTMCESGERCFNQLINSSLIQPEEIDGAFGGHEVKSCRVHDTVHDFIVSKAVEENFVTIIGVPGVVNPDPQNKARRLSLQKNGEIPPGLVVSSARSLHVFGRNVKIPSMSEFRLLRVLDFDDCTQLQDDDLAGIGKLLHLKYLHLGGIGSWLRDVPSMTELPEELARLQHLEIHITQDCEHGKVIKIPEIIQKQLVCYVNVFAEEHTALQDDIVCIQGLRVLENLSVYDQSIEFLKRLGMLKNLRKLGVHFETYDDILDEDWKKKQEAAAFSISQLGGAGLESLSIHIDMDPDFPELFVLQEKWFPCPPCGLRELEIKGVWIKKVPEWMASLVHLEKLSLPLFGISEEGMEILGALPKLSYLGIRWYNYEDPDFDSDDEEKGPKVEAAVVAEVEAAMRRAMEAHPNRPTLVWM